SFSSQTPWVVLEYASPDANRAMATLFRTSAFGDSTFKFVPRGLDVSRTYRVTFRNRNQTIVRTGFELMQNGVSVPLEVAGTSEMLLFQDVAAQSKPNGMN